GVRAAAQAGDRAASVACLGWGGSSIEPHARRPEPLECRQGSFLGAAADRAGVRGEVRSYGRRPVSPRHGIPALATGQEAQGLPLRPARGHTRLRAGEGVRGRGLSFSATWWRLIRIRSLADERPRL